MGKGLVFEKFTEGKINFAPSYKYDPGTDTYDTSFVPFLFFLLFFFSLLLLFLKINNKNYNNKKNINK